MCCADSRRTQIPRLGWDFPGGPVVKNLSCNAGDTATTEPMCCKYRSPCAYSPCSTRTAAAGRRPHTTARSSLYLPTRESPRTATKTPQPKTNILINQSIEKKNRICLAMSGTWVQSLVEESESSMHQGNSAHTSQLESVCHREGSM